MGRGRALLAVVLSAALLLGGPAIRAFAAVSNATGTNVQDGNNNGNTHQGGASASGDAVGGQVTGVVAAGRTSVDARNVSKDSSVESGDASASNTSRSFVGLAHSGGDDIQVGTEDLSFITGASNLQDGNNAQTLNQTANATTGDGVAGEVIGVVTAAGGSASVVAANTSSNVDVTTGDADSANVSDAFVGLAHADDEVEVGATDITNVNLLGNDANLQDGNNRQTLSQSATSGTGDGVAGQVIGVVAGGATSVDANNTSDNSSVDTGDASAANSSGAFVGLAFGGDDVELNSADISNVFNGDHINVQDGNNRQSGSQRASSKTGDGVAGEVIGAVTSAGGSASIVAANTSRDSDVTTGDADTANESAAFVGLANSQDEVEIGTGDISNIDTALSSNFQDGNNRQTLSQASNATTGDGVAGQVIGAVSAGATSIDARNSSDGVSVDTGDASASNQSTSFVGIARAFDETEVVIPADITGITGGPGSALQVQDGNNAQTLSQSANATTGDGVAGEVIGAVTSAGGSASIVAANTSRDSDVTTGDATADNDSGAFVGIGRAIGDVELEPADITGITAPEVNAQDGNNRQTLSQSSSASTGDGVAGQVIGAVSAGATSIDARNTSDGVSIDTGDATAANDSAAFVGLATSASFVGVGITDVSNIVGGRNVQDGNNRQSLSQSSSASSGDGVAGEVLGAVTSAGGSTSIVAANTSRDSDVTTGDAESSNDAAAFVGLASSDFDIVVTDVTGVIPLGGVGSNVQDGNNSESLHQAATASTGDGIAGQVIGVVSAGATSVDATNLSEDVTAESGDANATNSSTSFVGLAASELGEIAVVPADVSGVTATNVQDGSNRKSFAQTADASSGDAVSGQVLAGVTAGVITGAGGQASVVVANTSTSLDSTTGDAQFDNSDFDFVGLAAASGPVTIGPLL